MRSSDSQTSWRVRGAAFAFVLATLALAACDSPIPRIHPSYPAFAERSPAELDDLARGRSEYISKCSGCHRLYLPTEESADYWRHWTEEMAGRSKLSENEQDRIIAYLTVASRFGAAD